MLRLCVETHAREIAVILHAQQESAFRDDCNPWRACAGYAECAVPAASWLLIPLPTTLPRLPNVSIFSMALWSTMAFNLSALRDGTDRAVPASTRYEFYFFRRFRYPICIRVPAGFLAVLPRN